MARIDQPTLLKSCLYLASPGGGTLRCTACQTHKKIVCGRRHVSDCTEILHKVAQRHSSRSEVYSNP
jgi:hypothetical protein